jgi:ABC-type transport system involved in multi-copper enzyme maturation permease subunit
MNVIFILVELLVFLLCIISLIIGAQNRDPYRRHKLAGVFVYSYLIGDFLMGSSTIGGIYEGEIQSILASFFILGVFILSIFGGEYIFDMQKRRPRTFDI